MGRNSRKNGLNFNAIFVNGKPIRTSLLSNTWTYTARECYKRGCNCKGCDLVPMDSLDTLEKCHIKDYVMGYIQLGIYPKGER